MGLKTAVSKAAPQTKSLRATIPEGIVEFLSLKDGDRVDWEMMGGSGNDRFAVVRKA